MGLVADDDQSLQFGYFDSGGALLNRYPAVDYDQPNQGTVGAYLGGGLSGFVTNAGDVNQLSQGFATQYVNVGIDDLPIGGSYGQSGSIGIFL